MPLTAIVVDATPDPVAIAQRLAGRPGFAFLHGASDSERGRRSFVAVEPVETRGGWLPPAADGELLFASRRDAARSSEGGGERALREIERRVSCAVDTRGAVPRWIGAIPYESARTLERARWTRTPDDRPAPHMAQPIWQRYAAVVDVDPARGIVQVVGDEASQVTSLARELRGANLMRRARGTARLLPLPVDETASAHVERVERAQDLIRAGDLYQVNLARRLRFTAEGSALDLYLAIAERSPAAFGGCLDLGGTVVCASSPELFLAVDPSTGRVLTAPIKGTRPRGRDASEDLALCRELDQSAKERAELTMILDVERNDLGKVCESGSVRLLEAPRVETHAAIHHRAALLGGVLRRDVAPIDAVRAMFPSGSVTGAPKVRAMEVIARLEPVRRGLYTGAFGYVAYDGSIELGMAIRVLTMKNGEAHYFAGGGIVADSDPAAELEETRWKATQIERLAGGAPAENASSPPKGAPA